MQTPKRTLRGPMRLLVPLAISATLHAGAISGPNMYKWFQNLGKTPVAQTAPLQEDILRTQRPKGQNPFLAERESYVSELLSLLKTGKEISISEFFLKSELLDKNIRAFDAGDTPYSEGYYKGQYQMLVSRAKEHLKGKKFKLKHLHIFFHTEFTRGYAPKQGNILDMLDSNWGNCNASTQLFSALIEDVLGIKDQKFLLYTNHIASILGKRKIENTSHKWEASYQLYDGCGAKLSKESMVAAYLLANGVQVPELPPDLQEPYLKTWKWPDRCRVKPEINSGLVNGAKKKYPPVNLPGSGVIPTEPIPNPDYVVKQTELSPKEVVAYAKIARAAYFFYLGESTPQGGNTVEFEPYSLEGVDWKKMMKYMKELTLQNVLLQYYPREYRLHNKLQSITSSQILSLVNSLPENAGEDLKEKLCSEYSFSAWKSPPKQIIMDFPYSFCTKEIGWIKYRYASGEFAPLNNDPEVINYLEKSTFDSVDSIVLVHLLEYLTPDDFQFFQNEFNKANTNIQRRYAAYGMVISDWKAGCEFISHHSNSSGILKPKIICCRDLGAIWENALDLTDSEGRGLTFLRGAYLSEEEMDSLVAVSQEHAKNRSVTAVLKLSRIMAEYADSLEGHSPRKAEFSRYALDLAKFAIENTPDSSKLNTFFAEFSPKHASLLIPTLENGCTVGHTVSRLAPIIDSKLIPKEAIDALKSTVLNPADVPYARVQASIILLDLGIDPLE